MRITIIRRWFTDKSTIGELYVDGIMKCFTLEDAVRDKKIYGETAIPAGKYDIEITYSPRFKCELPLIKNVKGFDGVRIHAGNTAADTEGCILVGMFKGPDTIHNSRQALKLLLDLLKNQSKITLEILNE